MKRYLPVLLGIAIVLSGCSSTTKNNTQNAGNTTTEINENETITEKSEGVGAEAITEGVGVEDITEGIIIDDNGSNTITLHSGTTFDMSADEIQKIEKENGFKTSEEPDDSYLEYKGTFAGIKNSYASYSFIDKQLYQFQYSFDSFDESKSKVQKDYEDINSLLVKKYGKPLYSEKDGDFIDLWDRNIDDYMSRAKSEDEVSNVNMCGYSEWLIEQDGYSVFIDHYYYVLEGTEMMIGGQIPFKGDDHMYHELYYIYVDDDAENDSRLGKEASNDL